ncbi:SGNH/GDSL hydrolase family protein [Actinoplanes palleronii]|uniref:SGNH/GDSL hydrolase family protein n=1 Tax=Actinoplanes palleronii TaxID=113570 RepID=UPI001942FCCD|nr:SGNH/GDSL hydrolase family protein [Actinoplanes palleronii]
MILSALRTALAVAGIVLAGASPVSAQDVPAPSPLRIMPLGDSITMGIGSASLSSYRVDLQRRLTAAGLDVDFVGSQHDGVPATADLDHEGHSGWTIAKIAAQVDGWLSTSRPDAVLLQIGTNDLRTEAGAAGATYRLSALIDRITAAAPEAEVFVAKITGTRSAAAAAQQKRTDTFNAQVPGIVAAKSARVHLVDQSTVTGIDIRDGLHPNDAGFAKMSWNWFRAMVPVLGLKTDNTTTISPYAVSHARFCHLVDGTPGPGWSPYYDCRWYWKHLAAPGRAAKAWTWQAKRGVTETRRVRVHGRWVTRTVTVSTWVSFDPNRHDR